MNAVHRILDRPSDGNLTQVVEPLADYICASEKPEVLLRSVLAVLRRQIRATNGLAATHHAVSQRMVGQAI